LCVDFARRLLMPPLSQTDSAARAKERGASAASRMGARCAVPIKPRNALAEVERLVAEYSAAAKAAHVALEKWVDEMDW